MDKFNINDYIKDVQEPLKGVIQDAYCDVFGKRYEYDIF